jgi:hypothetical protein
MNNPTAYTNGYQLFVRALAQASSDWERGCNVAASCAPGIGIASDVTNLSESLPSWTLLDQNSAAREPQDSACIGLAASAILPGVSMYDSSLFIGDGYGATAYIGKATLADLEAGWTYVP